MMFQFLVCHLKAVSGLFESISAFTHFLELHLGLPEFSCHLCNSLYLLVIELQLVDNLLLLLNRELLRHDIMFQRLNLLLVSFELLSQKLDSVLQLFLDEAIALIIDLVGDTAVVDVSFKHWALGPSLEVFSVDLLLHGDAGVRLASLSVAVGGTHHSVSRG